MITTRVICDYEKIIRNYVVLHSDQTSNSCGMHQHVYTYTYYCNVTRQGSNSITYLPCFDPHKKYTCTHRSFERKERNTNMMCKQLLLNWQIFVLLYRKKKLKSMIATFPALLLFSLRTCPITVLLQHAWIQFFPATSMVLSLIFN